jgi:bisphosphoglycerate-independent phosphoglycerate mutase (AlkP superfamily)
MGKELLSETLTPEELDMVRKMFFYCSCERWTETEKKLESLMEEKVRPCVAPGFCAINSCNIEDNDTILFFNTRKSNYDKYINAIYTNAPKVFKKDDFKIDLYSLIKLDTKFNVGSIAESIVYDNILANILNKGNLKALIITKNENISYINFLANGLNYVKNPRIDFMVLDNNYLSNPTNIANIIDNTNYNLIIFDYHMDVSKTVNELKEGLEKIDVVLGNVVNTCANKHSLFITSLYGLKKDLPLAPYNSEIVTIDYEMQIPIFFFDYTFPRGKYRLVPGETNDILNTAIRCVWDNKELTTLVKTKGLLTSLLFK